MSDATLLLLRLSFLALLWLFVLLVVAVLRAELAPRRTGAAAKQSAKAAPAARPKGGVALITLHTAAGPRAIEIDAEQITFGRSADNTVKLDDDYASSHHCRVTKDGKNWQLEDIGSTNGTYVKGNRISAPIRMKSGSRFTVGSTEIELP